MIKLREENHTSN